MCGPSLWSRCTVLLSALTVLCVPSHSAAAARFSGNLEGGPGLTYTGPALLPMTPGGMFCAGVGLPVQPGRVTFEVAASAGDAFAVSSPASSSLSGARSLTTFLLGIEAVNHTTGRGPFASLGVGVGHTTLSGARDWQNSPTLGWLTTNRNLTGFAFGGGVGLRSAGGFGPLGLQIALRFHGLADAGRVVASCTAVTLGLAY